jgi:hypothetical protein
MAPTSLFGSAIACLRGRQLITAILGGLLLLVQTAVGQTTGSTVTGQSTGTQQSITSLPTLSNGTHQLKAGETQSFRIPLAVGQFLNAVVEQKDIDVVVVSFDPNGKQIGEMDSPNDRWGSESVVLVAAVAGDYRVDVRSTNSKASAGQYDVKIVALRSIVTMQSHSARMMKRGNLRRSQKRRQNVPQSKSILPPCRNSRMPVINTGKRSLCFRSGVLTIN